ncbi:hypothetical protein [Streptomyces sp. NPDC017524]|uniref:hypothetical protein n=1 Tax=Streptomyces sp. NPDC017524 TaxID=3364999 RepID=UPI0037A9AF5D
MSDVPLPSACRTCGHNWPRTRDYYHVDYGCTDGLKRQCRSCANEEARRRYAVDPVPARERVRTRRAEMAAHWNALWSDEAPHAA